MVAVVTVVEQSGTTGGGVLSGKFIPSWVGVVSVTTVVMVIVVVVVTVLVGGAAVSL